jgi:hypothetical protein
MPNLSPAAQAILDAALGEAGPAFEPLVRAMAAAALRAVAAQADHIGDRLCVPAHNIIAIATELESINA